MRKTKRHKPSPQITSIWGGIRRNPSFVFGGDQYGNRCDTHYNRLRHLIRETQSVRDACSRMQISYSTAWNLLNSAEDSLGYPLILRNKGGPSGSGSLLTEKGSALLAASEGFEMAARENLEKLYNDYFRDII